MLLPKTSMISAIVIVTTFHSPSCLGQATAKRLFGLQVKLPPAHLSTTHGGGFTLLSPFNCWASSRKTVNTNFYSLWFDSTENRTRVYRFNDSNGSVAKWVNASFLRRPWSNGLGSIRTLVTLLRSWIRRFTMIISAWWLRTSSKFSGQEFEEIHRNIGSPETPKQVRIPPITK